MVWRAYDRATTFLLALCGFAMFALAIGNAFLRYFLDSPLIWSEEISRYTMVWGTMIGVALAYRASQHVAITLMGDALPKRARLVLRLFLHLLALATAAVLLRTGYPLVAALGLLEAPSSGLRMVWAYAAIPTGGVLLAIEAVRLLGADLRGWREIGSDA